MATTREDLLEALKEFDRLADPLDLTSVLVDAREAAKMREALRAGRKLSRIARAAVTPPGPPAEKDLPTADEVYGILSKPDPTPEEQGRASEGLPTLEELRRDSEPFEDIEDAVSPDGQRGRTPERKP